MTTDKTPGLKERELCAHGKCPVCGKPLINGELTFYRLTVERAAWYPEALSRRHGMQMLMGGSSFLAQALGPDEDLAKIMQKITVYVHESCAAEAYLLYRICSNADDKEEQKE